MVTIYTPYSAKRQVQNHIYMIPETNRSRSAYILLYDKRKALDDSEDWATELKRWLLFRKEFLQSEIVDDKLTCSYCGRDDLIEGYHESHKKHLNHGFANLATVDHIHPLSKNGEKYNRDNCCVSCRRCNSKKGNKIIDV